MSHSSKALGTIDLQSPHGLFPHLMEPGADLGNLSTTHTFETRNPNMTRQYFPTWARLWRGFGPTVCAALGFAALLSAPSANAAPPTVTVTYPNGGETLTGGDPVDVQWTATDDTGIAEIQVFYRDSATADWKMVLRQLPNSGTATWSMQNTPTTEAQVRVLAIDFDSETGEDTSDGDFTILQTPGGFVATTLRDFELPGSQPFAIDRQLDPSNLCYACHGGYDLDNEPGHTYFGSMMHHAARDPLFFASLAIAEQDAPSSGDYCIRCHTPGGWLDGRSQPTDGSGLIAADRDGVSCDFCHKMVDPVYEEGISPVEDVYVLEQLDEIPTVPGHGTYIVDPAPIRRGPFQAPEAYHAWLESPYHQSSDMCGTCHSLSNPAFDRVSGEEYVPGPLDAPATNLDHGSTLPIERTFHEWQASDYNTPQGIYAPQFAGNKADGYVSSCQDCHMRDAEAAGCNSEFAPIRPDMPTHDLTGGNTFIPKLVRALYPAEVNSNAIDAGIERARYMLQNAAEIEVGVASVADSFLAEVTVTNQTGHKLPTGYPEGRRMWINLRAFDESGSLLHESANYNSLSGDLDTSGDARIYEMKHGLSPSWAATLGLPEGPSFHFVLNDTIYKDNRIPARGFTNADYDAFGGKPKEAGMPVPRYPDGHYWDTTTYNLPPETAKVVANLYYQTMSKEYAEFLRDENTTNDAGTTLYDLWTTFSKSPPELMVSDTLDIIVADVDVPGIDVTRDRLRDFAVGPVPFHDDLGVSFRLTESASVRIEVFDLQGRRLRVLGDREYTVGPQRIEWDGRDSNGNDAGSGIFFVRTTVGDEATDMRRVVRLK